MKKTILSLGAAIISNVCMAQLNIDFSPATSTFRDAAPTLVHLACAAILIVSFIVVGIKYRKDRDEMWGGFVSAFFTVFMIWAAGQIAVTTFLN